MANDTDTAAFEEGVNHANDATDTPSQEMEDVAKWFRAIENARQFDAAGLRAIARDRDVLSGVRKTNDPDISIAPTYVEILESFLYTRNPTVQIDPSSLTEPPPQKAILAKSVQQILAKRQQQFGNMQQMAQIGKQAMASMPPAQMMALKQKGDAILAQHGAGQLGGFQPPPEGSDITQMQPPQNIPDNDPEVQGMVNTVMQPYQQKRDDAKQFAATMEVAIQKTWETADLKSAGKSITNAALSIGQGWFKASWQERMGEDPTTIEQIRDIKEQIAELNANRVALEDDADIQDSDQRKALLEQQIEGIREKGEVVVKRGFMIEPVNAEDVQVSTEVTSIADYQKAQWIAHYTYPTVRRAKADYPDIADKIDDADKYYAVKSKKSDKKASEYEELQYVTDANATTVDAFQFRKAGDVGTSGKQDSEACVRVIEIYDRTTTNTITLIEGLKCYAKQPYVPEIESTRGIPLFLYQIGKINGRRFPRSLIDRTLTLLDEYKEIRAKSREMRRRAVPKTAYNRGNLKREDIDAIAAGTVGEMIGLDPLNPEVPVSQLIAPIVYNNYDPALADTSTVRSELEQIWGVAEALSGATVNPQTATESEIQNTGTHSRLGKCIDDLDDVTTDLAQYTGEVLLQTLDADDIEEMCGPWALWPEGLKIDDMSVMLSISVKAGSSGKPATAQQQQAWAMMYPQLKETIVQVGQLRGSSPDEIADCLESLMEETVRRAGDRIDITQFIPDAPRVPPPPPPQKPRPMQDTALNGQQITAMSQLMVELRGKMFSDEACMAALTVCYPNAPAPLLAKIVKGSTPQPGDPPTQINSKNVETNSPDQKQPGEQNPNTPAAQSAQPANAAMPAQPATPPPANGATPP